MRNTTSVYLAQRGVSPGKTKAALVQMRGLLGKPHFRVLEVLLSTLQSDAIPACIGLLSSI